MEKVEELRAVFAASIGADRDEIGVMPSASAGINAVASALDFQAGRSGVTMGEFEFPTMAQVWLAQQRRGAVVQWARAAGDRLEMDAYAAVVDQRTLIVPAMHVCFRNGHKTDIAALTALCHSRGAYVFLDDYQRTGSGPIDVHALGVDFMVTGCLKYLLAAAGVGFLYVRRDLIERLEPTVTGWFGRINPFAFRIDAIDWSSTASRFESGTPPVPSAYAALGGLSLLNRIGYDVVASHIDRWWSGIARRPRPTASSCEPRPSRHGADRSSWSRASMGRKWCHASPRVASWPHVVAMACGYRFTRTTTKTDVDAVVSALVAESALLVRHAASRR